MGKKVKNAGRKRAIAAAKEIVCSPATAAAVRSAYPASDVVVTLVAEIASIHPEIATLDRVISFALSMAEPGDAAHNAWRVLQTKFRAGKQQVKAHSSHATHREKRQSIRWDSTARAILSRNLSRMHLPMVNRAVTSGHGLFSASGSLTLSSRV
ncbi:hypothetical protein B0H12DRAFT_233632 [Mycena haematopus]|nr:hypothetical protein B0H12DRAFT_233632 [Mycena haematopus]